MATVATQAVTPQGLDPVYSNASGTGDRVAPGSIVHVLNTNPSALTVTYDVLLTMDGDLAVADRVISGIAGTNGKRFIKVPNNTVYADPADGLVKLTWSVTTGVTFAVIS